MDKIELEKNRLDLSYKRNLQLMNIILISGFGAIFAYIARIILNPKKILAYTLVLTTIILVTYLFYRGINNNLKEISNRIKKLI